VIRFDHWYLPDGETHLQEWMLTAKQIRDGRFCYQLHKYEFARKHVRDRVVAVDVGAHVGLWSYWMAKDFQRVIAFEPKPEHQQCWIRNVPEREGVTLYGVALGNVAGRTGLTHPKNSGDAYLSPGSEYEVCRLDDYHLDRLDFLKIDCEGYEVFVLEGGAETIQRCRPVVIVEQKPGHAQRFGRKSLEAVQVLESWGASMVKELAGDYVMTFQRPH
jgi:FkbM family methyltransferase